jgi:hypothetical protein
MRLPWRTSAQAPQYARYWSEQRHLDYWTFGLLLLAVLVVLYMFAISQGDGFWLDRLISRT